MIDVVKTYEILGAVAGIGGLMWAVFKFVNKLTKMDKKLDSIMLDQYKITKGTIAALEGLVEQGCNGPVKEALKDLRDHNNRQAHKFKEE